MPLELLPDDPQAIAQIEGLQRALERTIQERDFWRDRVAKLERRIDLLVAARTVLRELNDKEDLNGR